MKYISTRGQAPVLDFEETLLAGLAVDGGLYVPAHWPQLSPETIAGFKGKPYAQVAYEVLRPFVGGAINDARFQQIVEEAYSGFDHKEIAPLVHLGGRDYLLELFHGPTLAFKDVAMQLLARLMDEALNRRGQRATIIGATSGDTGGAAIEAFAGRDTVDMFIFYPQGRVSDVQRKQMTTPENANVHAVAVEGTFDDCQALVKAMFTDTDFRSQVNLAGVNSINWARVMAQTVYYFTAAVQLGAPDKPVAFSVPTGNFGDIFAGYVAAQMGLPIAELMIATNVNDILVRTLETGSYVMGDVVATSSPSMDIQVSSNFERLLFEASGRDDAMVRQLMQNLTTQNQFTVPPAVLAEIRKNFSAERVDEQQTAEMMLKVLKNNDMLIDPHSAIGLAAGARSTPGAEGGARSTLGARLGANVPIISLATAHPAKFPLAVEKACGRTPKAPPRIVEMMKKPEHSDILPNDLQAVQSYILEKGAFDDFANF